MNEAESRVPLSTVPDGDRRAWIVANGCYSAEENARIHDKWFSRSRPRDSLLAWLSDRIDLEGSRLCDVGCAYGMHVLLGAPGSYGIELEHYETRFARSLGLTVHELDVVGEDLTDLPQVDLVLALAILEHLDSPHVVLRKLHGLLAPGGLLVLETPRRPPLAVMERVPVIRRAFSEHDDHVNGFTASTLRFSCTRAGFEVLWHRFWSKPLVNSWGFSPRLSGVFPFRLVANGLVLVARKVDGWQYPPKATRRAALNSRGYEPVGQPFPELEDMGAQELE